MKVICLLRRKPGLSFEEFRHLYETEHAPRVARLAPHFREYRRSYLQRGGEKLIEEVDDVFDVDVVTELWFDDRAQFDRFIACLSVEDVHRELDECEHRFLDLDARTFYIVDETTTLPGG